MSCTVSHLHLSQYQCNEFSLRCWYGLDLLFEQSIQIDQSQQMSAPSDLVPSVENRRHYLCRALRHPHLGVQTVGPRHRVPRMVVDSHNRR